MMEKRWIARSYLPGDETGILKLREKIWGDLESEKLSLEFWRWQFIENPAGKGFIQVADDHGVIVGHQPVIPTDFLIKGERVKFAMSVDTMTHPDYQKQGIFSTLSKGAYDEAAESSIEIVWGFPNENSRPGFLRNLAWSDITVLPIYAKILRTENLLKRYLGSPFFSRWLALILDPICKIIFSTRSPQIAGVMIQEIRQFDERFDHLWERNAHPHNIIQVRDSRYLQWRYFRTPLRRYRIFAAEQNGKLICYMVLRSMEFFDLKVGAVVDLFPIHADKKIIKALFHQAQALFQQEGMDLLVFMIPPQFSKAIKGLRFLKIPDFLNLKRWYVGLRYQGSRFTQDFLLKIENWFLTFGDTDIV